MFCVKGLCVKVGFRISKWEYLHFSKNFVALPCFVTHEAKESLNLKSESDLEKTLSVLLF